MISASKCRPLNSAGRFRLMHAEAYQTGPNADATLPSGATGALAPLVIASKRGLVSPQDAQERLRRNFQDPLFAFDGSDDGQGNGFSRMLADATILVKIPLPPNVSLADDPAARFVVVRRGIPTTHNTPALDPVLMLDGREPDLPTQARHAIENHAQNTTVLADSALRLNRGFRIE